MYLKVNYLIYRVEFLLISPSCSWLLVISSATTKALTGSGSSPPPKVKAPEAAKASVGAASTVWAWAIEPPPPDWLGAEELSDFIAWIVLNPFTIAAAAAAAPSAGPTTGIPAKDL